MEKRYIVCELRPDNHTQEQKYWVYDNLTKTFGDSGFRTEDGCQAMCDFKNLELTKSDPVVK